MDKTTRDGFVWLKRVWRERRPLLIAIALLLVGLPVVLYLAQDQDEGSPKVDTVISQAQTTTEDGDYGKAYEQLKAAENQPASKKQKVELYNKLAAAAANAGQSQEAIEYLELKHGLDPSTRSADAYMLATLYEEVGQPQEALAQYRVALEYYKSLPDDPFVDAKIESTEAVIQSLEDANE